MAIVQKINSLFTRNGESKSASDKTEQSSKMEKANNVDDTKHGDKDVRSIGKRTVWQRLKDKWRKTYSDNELLIVIGMLILAAVVIPSFEILGLLVSPYFFIPFGFSFLILIVVSVLSEINQYKIKRNKNKMK